MSVLLVVLALAGVAAATLVGAVFGGGAGLAWLSLVASALGVALLVYDRYRRRKPTRKQVPTGADPGEERSNAAEAADPEAGVVVIDERPRYHVATCEWVGSADTIKLTLREARELGFSPCARCAPNATIAAENPRTGR